MVENKKGYVSAIILAAGSGERMNANVTKQRIDILGKSLLWHTVKAFSDSELIDSIVVVCREDETEWASKELGEFSKLHSIVIGGKSRAESAKIGFESIDKCSDCVAIHDGARCLVTSENIRDVVTVALDSGAATAATKLCDTLKRADNNGYILETISRDYLWIAETPQVFRCDLYSKAILNLHAGASVTDDNMLIEALGERISIVETSKENIKVTTQDDISYVEYVLRKRLEIDEIRFGQGYDVHRLVEGRSLVLGGVEIPHTKGLLGHSDADVLVHAIMDALLGAMGLGDIGRHFPDTNDEFKGISSLYLLSRVSDMLSDGGYKVVNIDATVVLQRPKISPFINEMISNIAKVLMIERGRINIKATTEEGLDFTGREEGAKAYAIASLAKIIS